ncbi:MAG TPA: type II secretion system F family protein, partial [Verrucomicrobiae bacterium]|nr:type II secretion system F family protein [Verrucomicrobiae bacterium]
DYVCKVGTPGGQILEQVYAAETEETLRKDFEARDYFVYWIRRKSGVAALLDFSALRKRRISSKEFLIFNQELASLIQAGLPIVTSLEILMERRKNLVFKRALADIRDQVKAGASLSDAFESQGGLFPKIYASSLASGERSGEVATVLRRYIAYTKTILAIRKKVVSALIYPAILLVMAFGLVILLLTYILPKFREFYSDMGTELPLITRMLVGASGLVRDNVLIWIPLTLLTIVGVSTWVRTPLGALKLDTWKLKVPLLGGIWHRYAISRFTRTLATLTSGGIPLVIGLDISARAIGNRIFERRILEVSQKVREGGSLWESLEQTGIMTDMSVEMIKVGESTGALEDMLSNVANFYDEEIDNSLATLVALMEPAMLIFMGGVIATMLLAIYLPLIRSYTSSQY